MTAPPRVVIDPNVYVAAAIKPGGTCGRLVDAINADLVTAVACPLLLDELRAVLARPKLRRWITVAGADTFWRAVRARSEVETDPDPGARYTRDAADDYLVALAVASRAHAIVSGDPDLAAAELPVPVWTPRLALDRLAGTDAG